MDTLFGAETKWALMHTLLMAITRPLGRDGSSEGTTPWTYAAA